MYHQELADGKRHQMSIMEQLWNVWSEVSRSLSSYQNNNLTRFQPAFERMLELFSLSLSDKRRDYPKRKEIARLKEYILDYFVWDKQYWQTPENIMKDFNYYGIVANRKKLN